MRASGAGRIRWMAVVLTAGGVLTVSGASTLSFALRAQGRDPTAVAEVAEVAAVAEVAVGAEAGSLPIPRQAPSPSSLPRPEPDHGWLERESAATAIPARSLQAYARAQLALASDQPSCAIGWPLLAGIGAVESDHGRHGGAAPGPDGVVRPAIYGPVLDGTAETAVQADTDGGLLDADRQHDRAVGPMQFIPQTWATWGTSWREASAPDPQNIDDAALSAARYLCADGRVLTRPDDLRSALWAYNRSARYARQVAQAAAWYADRARSG